jgi:uncharacterized membrane protein (UPF0127 family)
LRNQVKWQKKVVRATNATRGSLLGERVRVADTGLARIVGLLGERELRNGDGLLIVPSQGVHTWGMRFDIDVAVVDRDWKVIGISHALRPFRMTRLFWRGAAVLELPTGTLNSTSTSVGDFIEFGAVAPAMAQADGVASDRTV